MNANCQATFSQHRRPRILTSLISGTEITYPIPLCVTDVLQARIHISFTEIGQIFHNIDILKKKLSKLQGFIRGEWNWSISCLDGSGTQESETLGT